MKFILLWAALLAAVVARAAELTDIRVRDAVEFRAALAGAKPGTRLLLAGGAYGGGFQRTNLRGEPGRPVVIAAADPQNPPVFSNAKTGLQLSNPAHLELHGLVFEKLSENGLNIDDGGSFFCWSQWAYREAAERIMQRGGTLPANLGGIDTLVWLQTEHRRHWPYDPQLEWGTSADAKRYVSRAWARARSECFGVAA